MNNLKLGVEVVSAHDLMPKDGQGSVSSFVELHFDHQRFRTVIKDKDLNPSWNEQFYFNISDPSVLSELNLEASVYHINRETNAKNFIGKVKIPGTSFVPFSDAVAHHYPLEKRHLLSRVRGELGLKVFLTSDPSIRASNPLPAIDHITGSPVSVHSSQLHGEMTAANLIPFQDSRAAKVQTFHHIPREQMQQQYYSSAPAAEQPMKILENQMRPPPPQPLRMLSSSSQQPLDFQLKETSPSLGGGRVYGGRLWPGNKGAGAFDLVEKMEFLYVRVVKARDLPSKDVTGSLDPYVEVRLGNFKGATKHLEKNQKPEWHHVFAFSRERLQSSTVEIVLKDKDLVKDDFVGLVRFDINEIPSRVPPDSPLAPEWYRLEDKKGDKTKGELMLAVWFGTQADEAFAEATHSEAALASDADTLSNHLRAKVYHAPRLWYLRVNIIEAQDAIISDKSRIPNLLCKVRLGNQMVKTNAKQSRNANFMWNEEFLLVASEPFEEPLILSVEDRVGANKDEVIGQCQIPLQHVQRRLDDKPVVHSQWHDLRKPVLIDVEQIKETKFSSKIQARICLEGGYHVLDESTQYSSDLRPTAKQLWKQPIGLIELGILNANGLPPMKTRDSKGTCDAYCVAKYGQKWIRTRTILNDLNPRFNEQYTWDVHDHSTVLTIGVFDNCQLKKSDSPNHDQKIGKVRIRLSTLETGRVYTHSYPLLVLHSSGVKKMGELHLAIRFSSTSLVNTMFIYTKPHLPKMHYIKPIPIQLQDILKHQAVQIVSTRLGRTEPPLRKEVIEYMTDAHSHLFSMRKSKANFFRLMTVFSGIFAVSKWFSGVCAWNNPLTTVLVHILFTMLVCYPQLILPTIFLYTFLIGIWNYRFRPRHPPHMNTRISYAEAVNPDELDEEFDYFPTTRSPEVVKMRYDRLRSVAGRIQTVVGDIATQGERIHLMLTWRDPRATMMFLVLCLGMALVLYVTPFQVVVLIGGLYVMRHPKLRNRMPSPLVNFFRRLPARTDTLL